MEDYLQLLEESLEKKLAVLEKIGEFNLKQRNIFDIDGELPDFEKFDSYIEEKGKLIDELNSLDEGFEALYARVADSLKENKEENASRIKRLQNLIRQVTDKSVMLQSQEAENKKLMEKFFKATRDEIGKGRNSLNAAYSYFESQRGTGDSGSLFFDSKK